MKMSIFSRIEAEKNRLKAESQEQSILTSQKKQKEKAEVDRIASKLRGEWKKRVLSILESKETKKIRLVAYDDQIIDALNYIWNAFQTKLKNADVLIGSIPSGEGPIYSAQLIKIPRDFRDCLDIEESISEFGFKINMKLILALNPNWDMYNDQYNQTINYSIEFEWLQTSNRLNIIVRPPFGKIYNVSNLEELLVTFTKDFMRLERVINSLQPIKKNILGRYGKELHPNDISEIKNGEKYIKKLNFKQIRHNHKIITERNINTLAELRDPKWFNSQAEAQVRENK